MPKKMYQNLVFMSVALLCISSFNALAKAPDDYRHAKKIANQLFKNHRQTLYCQCPYDSKKRINLKACHMEKASHIKRAQRMEWEHMMPAENFGRQFKCWREKLCVSSKNGKRYRGRKCCQKISPEFRKAEAELYNLWPAVGLVNQARSNYRYSPLPSKTGFYGCSMEIDKKARKASPPSHARGIVARANLFMADKYKIRLSKSQRKLFDAWNKTYPPSKFEKRWAADVAKITGYKNKYISE